MKIVSVGSLLGMVAFLAVGLLPAMAYGGYAGVLLANGIGFAHKSLTTFGMILGVAGVAALFAVLGAITGTAAYGLTYAVRRAALRTGGTSA
jgi:hypothetical protein